MKNIMRKRSLRTTICLMLVLVMAVTILPENVQAATSTPGFTLDLTDLASPMPLAAYGKATAGARFMDTSKISIPEGTTIYVADDRFTCSSMHIYRVFYNGRAFNMDSKYVADLKDTAAPDHYSSQDREKAEGSAVVGNITDPYHYFYIYAKPSAKIQNCRGAVAAGETIEIFKEKYNSKWAKILWHTPNGHNIFGYIQRKYINSADSYLAGAERSHQQAIKLAKKEKLTYSGILKNYSEDLTKAEFCRLAVNWYKATGHKLPKQRKKSPYTDTKDPYVIMAHQLGIIKSTSNKKFYPKKELSIDSFNSQMKKLVQIAGEPASVGIAGMTNNVRRDVAIHAFHRAYALTKKTDYLDIGVHYVISPADNPNVCLGVWGTTGLLSGTEIGLCDKKDDQKQVFYLYQSNGFNILYNNNSHKRLTGTTRKVYQDVNGYECQKITFEYNDDGTVCIRNGEGLYLDIKGGQAVNGAHLIYAPKSGSSTQNFVFDPTVEKYN